MINSEHFGMTFWLDDNNDFCYCPTFVNNEPDEDNWGYVNEWDEITSTDLDKLFGIHRHLVLQSVDELEEKYDYFNNYDDESEEDLRELTKEEQINYIINNLMEVN